MFERKLQTLCKEKKTIYKKKGRSYTYTRMRKLLVFEKVFFLLLNDHLANEIRVLGFRLIMNRVRVGEGDASKVRSQADAGVLFKDALRAAFHRII